MTENKMSDDEILKQAKEIEKKRKRNKKRKNDGRFMKNTLIILALYMIYFNERCFYGFEHGVEIPGEFIVTTGAAIIAEVLNCVRVKIFKIKKEEEE